MWSFTAQLVGPLTQLAYTHSADDYCNHVLSSRFHHTVGYKPYCAPAWSDLQYARGCSQLDTESESTRQSTHGQLDTTADNSTCQLKAHTVKQFNCSAWQHIALHWTLCNDALTPKSPSSFSALSSYRWDQGWKWKRWFLRVWRFKKQLQKNLERSNFYGKRQIWVL